MVDDRDDEGTGRVEDEVWDFEISDEVVGSTKEEIRMKGKGVVGIGSDSTKDGEVEKEEDMDEGDEGGPRREITQMLNNGGEEEGVGMEGEDQGAGREDGKEKGIKEGEAGWRK